MLHWQAPKWLSRISLEARVIVGSTLLHLMILIALFVVYQGGANYNVTISSNMINPNSEIIFMPLHRSIKQHAKQSPGGAKQAASKTSTTASKLLEEPGTTLVKIVQAKPKPKAKKEVKKASDKKNQATTKTKEKETVTQPTPKASDSAKASTDRTAGREKDSKKIETKSSEKIEKTEPKVESKHTEPSAQEQVKENNMDGASDSVVYVGQEEMDSLQAQEYIQQELVQHWAPPVGMRSDLSAVITLTIDFEGIIKQVELTQASGNLLFDTAAKKAAAQITPARWTFGKKMAITFKP